MQTRRHYELRRDPAGGIEITASPMPGGLMISVMGEVDLSTSPAVEQKLLRAAESHDLVALDLRKTTFMDSTGIHAIVVAEQRLRDRGGHLVVVQGPPPIRRLFKLTHLDDYLDLVEDAAELNGSPAAARA